MHINDTVMDTLVGLQQRCCMLGNTGPGVSRPGVGADMSKLFAK